MSTKTIQIAYDGEALRAGAIDVRTLAPALLAFGELCEAVNAVLNDDHAQMKVNVRSDFKGASFEIRMDIVQSFLNQAQSILLGPKVAAVTELAKLMGLTTGAGISLFRFIKWLRGQKPTSATTLENGNIRIEIKNVKDSRIEINPKILQLYNDSRIRKAAADVVKPLERDGIDVFEIRPKPKGKPIETIRKSDLSAFVEASMHEPELHESEVAANEITTVVRVIKPSLDVDEDYKWSVSDGEKPYFVEMRDMDFLKKVKGREIRFGVGDLMRVKMYIRSVLSSDGNIRNERTIREVIQFIEPPKQLPLIKTEDSD